MLLFFGLELWFLIFHGLGIRPGQPLIIAIAAVLGMIRPVARLVASLLDRIAHPSPSTARIAMLAIFLISIAFFYFEALSQQRDFQLRYQDEYSYRIQTLMIAHGRLWEPAHPLPEFFESFQLLAAPVYASAYFPGSAMLYAPGVWLHLAPWMIPLLASAGIVALVYSIFTELVDGVAGLLGVILMLSNAIFREQSLMVMSQVPALLGALLLVWAYLRWQRSRGTGIAFAMGLLAGWLLITRPPDAIVAIVPVGVAVLEELRAVSWNRRRSIVLAGVIGMLPFLILQAAFNLRVTGHLAESPFAFYTHQVYPGATYGFHKIDPAVRPTWPLPQVQAAYDALVRGALRDHTPAKAIDHWMRGYLPDTIQNILPHSLLILMMPVGLMGLRDRRWIVFLMLPLFVLVYFPYVFFIRHYSVIVMPAGILIVCLGVRVLSNFSRTARPQILTFLIVCVAGLSISEWSTFNRFARDEFMPAGTLRSIDATLASLPHRPAIVLFHFSPGDPVDLEPAYNADVAWPDDAPVIRAHDRGDENVKLFQYYSHRQPDRWVYIYTMKDSSLSELGKVSDLAPH